MRFCRAAFEIACRNGRQGRPSARRSWAAVPILLLIAFATQADELSAWQRQALSQGLGLHPEWLALVHYENALRPGRYRSFVDDPRFFLSPQGDTSPEQELAATLAALAADPAVSCRFIARRQWLSGQLAGLEAALPATECPEYEEWRRVLGVNRVVLVFASSYLNSPSSMYGHTFLRFDSGNPERSTPMLSHAVNFGANIPPDENGLVYAWRGLFGGYPGLFAAGPYFAKLREYSRLENRDLWEYRLDLDAAEVDRLLAHLWELRDIRFDYYFFDENCSLRLLELLDVARPGSGLAQRFRATAIPIDTVRVVIDAGMVDAVNYRPASRTVLEHQLRSLNSAERALARRLADDATLSDGEEFSRLPAGRQREVVNVAYGYLRYRSVHEQAGDDVMARNYRLLRLVNELADPAEPPAPPPQPPAPENGHGTGLLAFGAGLEENRAVADFEWRLSYHDLLDRPAGYPASSSLNMGRLALRLKEGGTLQLQRFDVLEITSLSPRDAFLRPWSWRVNTGLERQWTAGDDVLVPQVNAGFGWTWAPLDALRAHVLITGRAEYNHEFERELDLAPGVAAGLRAETRFGVTLVGVDHYRFTDGVDRTVLALRHNLALGTNLALRFVAERGVTETDRVDELGLALRFHF